MEIIVKQISWEQIKWIPKKYPREFAMFAQHKKPNFWLGAYCKEGDEDFPKYQTLELMGVCKILFLTKYHARHCSDFILPRFRRMGVSSRLTEEREKIAIQYGCTKIDYTADSSLEFFVPKGYIRKESRGNNGFRYEKDLRPYLYFQESKYNDTKYSSTQS